MEWNGMDRMESWRSKSGEGLVKVARRLATKKVFSVAYSETGLEQANNGAFAPFFRHYAVNYTVERKP